MDPFELCVDGSISVRIDYDYARMGRRKRQLTKFQVWQWIPKNSTLTLSTFWISSKPSFQNGKRISMSSLAFTYWLFPGSLLCRTSRCRLGSLVRIELPIIAQLTGFVSMRAKLSRLSAQARKSAMMFDCSCWAWSERPLMAVLSWLSSKCFQLTEDFVETIAWRRDIVD